MFQVVEFHKDSGGGIGIVRDVWLTPRKKETFWPPYRLSNQFNKALTEGQMPDDTWPVYNLERVFYITDVNVSISSLSTPPITDLPRPTEPAVTPKSSTIHDCQSSKSLEVIAKHLASIDNRLGEVYSNQQLLMAHFLPSPGPYPTPGTANSVHISGGSLIPSDLNLPCNSHEDLDKLEAWLENEDSQKALEKTLFLRGGKKINVSVPRMLEILFSNEFALFCNWTGKNQKRPLKNLKINKIIQSAVRRNHLTATATDFDITSIIRNWFRYTKDRDGGRERRRTAGGAPAPVLQLIENQPQ